MAVVVSSAFKWLRSSLLSLALLRFLNGDLVTDRLLFQKGVKHQIRASVIFTISTENITLRSYCTSTTVFVLDKRNLDQPRPRPFWANFTTNIKIMASLFSLSLGKALIFGTNRPAGARCLLETVGIHTRLWGSYNVYWYNMYKYTFGLYCVPVCTCKASPYLAALFFFHPKFVQ